MAACGSLQHIFDNPIPENPSSLIESLSSSWKQIKISVPVDHSFTEIFGELHFKENPNPTSSSSSSLAFPIDSILQGNNGGHQDNKKGLVSPFSNGYPGKYHQRSGSFSSMNSESLQLCTEGLGFESLDNIEDLKIEFHKNNNNNNNMRERVYVRGHSNYQCRKGMSNGRTFPPPISCIGRTGKPWVCFQSYREDGRFVLKEIRVPTQEILHACREDGRLRLCFIQPSDQDDDDDVIEEDDDGEEGGEGTIDEDEDEEEGEAQEGVEEGGEGEIRNDFEVISDVKGLNPDNL